MITSHKVYLLFPFLLLLFSSSITAQIERGSFAGEFMGIYDYGDIDSLGNFSSGGTGFWFAGAHIRAGVLYSWGKLDDVPTFAKYPDLDYRVRNLRGSIEFYPILGIFIQPTIGGEFGTFALGVKDYFIPKSQSQPNKQWERQYKSIYAAPTAGFKIYFSQKVAFFAKARYGFLLNNVDEDFGYDPPNFKSISAGISLLQFK